MARRERKPRFPPANDAGEVHANGTGGPAIVAPSTNGEAPAKAPPFLPPRASFPFSHDVRTVGTGNFRRHVSSRLPVEAHVSVTMSEEQEPTPEPAAPAVQEPKPFAPRVVVPPAPRAMPSPPTRIVGPPQHSAASSNAYTGRMADREQSRYRARDQVVQPEQYLVHAWTFALHTYPPEALTIWLTRTEPAENSYQFYVRGDELAADPYPDRKLYDTIRGRRRQPHVAEKFVGRIRGLSSEGVTLDIGGGTIELPPDPTQQPPTWAPASGAAPPPWMYGGQPTPPGPYGYGSPPGMTGAGPWGPWGMPPPWWAMMMGMGQQQQQTPPPPPAIAHDPAMVEMWKAIMSMQAATAQSSNEAQARSAEIQANLMRLFFERMFDQKTQGAGGAGGGMKDQIGLFREMAGLFKDLQGGKDDAGDDFRVIEIGGGDKVFATKGKIDREMTAAYAVKQGIEGLAKAVGGRMRAATPAQVVNAAAPGTTRTSSSSLPGATPDAK